MPKLAFAAAAIALAAPAGAQAPEPVFDPAMDEAIQRAIPHSSEVEAMAPAIDRVVGALLDVDIGPIVDAIEDPYRRGAYRGPRRTIGDMAGAGDPYFEERMRDSIYGTTAEMGRMMDTLAVVAPIVRRSLADMERDIERAVRERPPRRPPPRYDRRDD